MTRRDEFTALAAALLDWFDRDGRDLPWRVRAGTMPDPYRVWLSEIMLQQTTVAVVKPYFAAFLARWPRIEDLAAAELDDVLHAWQGLGYYARARNMHVCARMVVEAFGGVLPDDEEGLRRLPGIGAYTASAIAAIAFGRRTTPVDGNVARVMARLRGVPDPLPGALGAIGRLAAELTPENRPGDFAQAMMDLGATICMPRKPACERCPWRQSCAARRQGRPEAYPLRTPRPERPLRHGVVFWLTRPDGAVLVRRRPPRGLLGGMMEFPSTPWREDPWTPREARAHAPIRARWRPLEGTVDHGFTHFRLALQIWRGSGEAEGRWCALDALNGLALPTLMKKVARHAGRRAGLRPAPTQHKSSP